MTTIYTHMESPLGPLLAIANAEALTHLHMMGGKFAPKLPEGAACAPKHAIFVHLHAELQAYFHGAVKQFTVPLQPEGTPFQQEVWRALIAIPFGETRTYAQQAHMVGRPSAVRAVGAANGRNPIGIVIPCHRVIGARGVLTGYAGGLDKKEFLLKHEGILLC